MRGADASPERGRPRRIAVVSSACTGCEVCLEFCPVDCIDDAPTSAPATPPIHIRVEECIGCEICAKVCEELDLNAIDLVPVERLQGGPASPVAPAMT